MADEFYDEESMAVNILCFGDSNTYGYIPGGAGRFDRRTRWTGRLQKILGEGYRIIEEGFNGRTTAFEDVTCPGRCGLDAIGTAVELYSPVDLLIVMLGTNDCKKQFGVSPKQIAEGLEQVVDKAKASSPNAFKILLIAPVPMKEEAAFPDGISDFDKNSVFISLELAAEYEKLAEKYGCAFLDASKVTEVSGIDGVHLDAEGHEALAEAVAKIVRDL